MRERKTYRGARHSAGLKDEYNDIFKNRALEKKNVQSQKNGDHELQPQLQAKKSALRATNGGSKLALDSKPAKKAPRDAFDLDSSDDEDMEQSLKQATKPDPKPAKRAIEIHNGTNAKPQKVAAVTEIISSNSDSEPVRSKARAKPVAPKENKKVNARDVKRKTRASSDSDSELKSQTKKTRPSKETALKRKPEKDVKVEGVKQPAVKRQDRTTKSHSLPHPSSSKTGPTKIHINGNVKKDTTTKTTNRQPPPKRSESPDSEPVSTEIAIYDHAVDLSYAPMSSPTKKVPALVKEPSAVEMPSLLAELIESRVAEIEEQQPAKKLKRPVKKQKTPVVEVIEELVLLQTEEVPESKDAELQAQIQSAMFAADYGVRTTRSKFRNESAAKKSYSVAQRTMRHPVTEEEQMADQKLELDRTREEAANRARREEEKKKREAEFEQNNKASKKLGRGKIGDKEDSGKGKAKAKDTYDIEDDGPKVMSRHALLQKGRHQRVLNEIDALMEDAQKENPTRRSSILDVAHRMSNNTEDGKEFVQKFRLNSYDSKLLKNLNEEQDELTRIGYGWIMFILLNEELYSGRAIDLMLENGGFEMLKTMLTSDADLDDLAKSSVLKLQLQINQVTGKLRSRLLQCRFIRTDVPGPFSQRYVALMIIHTMLKGVNKDEGRKLILEQFDPRQFVEILSPLTGFAAPPTGPGLTNFYLSVSVLSHYSQSAHILEPMNNILEKGHLTVLSNVLPTVLEWNVFDSTENVERVKDFQTAVLKLCIDRTNGDPDTSTSIADHRNGLATISETCVKQFRKLSNVTDPEKDLSKDTDILILTGILLSNLLEFSETARMSLRLQKLGKGTLIKSLMDIFVERHDRLELAESFEETHLNVAFGYLTVALAYACRENDIRSQVRAQLRGSLEPLILAVTAFKDQNKALEDVENAASQEDILMDLREDAPTKLSYTSRLEDIVDELESYSRR
ncbi:hypothetical protein ABW20_dc0110399 [Dactylellina cionopaga]|nr:hypothetical protein ABW20_dc0110399 [Dactylellina cionopaga]